MADDKYRRPGNENSVRVTNLSDEVAEEDLHVSRFSVGITPCCLLHRISSLRLATSRGSTWPLTKKQTEAAALLSSISAEGDVRCPTRKTLTAKWCREDAERAIKTLDGYGYSNLILHCEWAAPKERK